MHCLEREEKLGCVIRTFFELSGGEDSSLSAEDTSPVRRWLRKRAISFAKLCWALSDWETEKLKITCWIPFPGCNTFGMFVSVSIWRNLFICSALWNGNAVP